MLVADASALVSLAIGDAAGLLLDEFDVHTTEAVVDELRETGEYDDAHATAARTVLGRRGEFAVHEVAGDEFVTSTVDEGEASCVALARERDPAFLLTDDLRALPELERLVDARVAISPIVLRALVERGVLDRETARDRLDRIAETRDWLGAPIYRRAQRLFE